MVKKDKKAIHNYEDLLETRGSAKTEKSKLMKFLLKRNLIQVVLILTIVIGVMGYFAYLIISLFSLTAVWFFLLLYVVGLVSAMWLFNKIGFAVCIMIILGVLVRYGMLATIALVWMIGLTWVYFSTRPTPIDFAITKGVQGALAMTVYKTIWIFIMTPIVMFLGTPYILNHLVFVYMLSTVIYVILMLIFLPLLAREPMPTACMNGMVMLLIEYVQVKLFGAWFFAYIMSI